MKPDEELDREQVKLLYARNEWQAAEDLLRKLAEADREDLSVAFQLGTLIALRPRADGLERHQEVIELYDGCATQNWAAELCFNNRGVVYALAGEPLSALSDLQAAGSVNGGYAPALYNLGMICQLVGETGGGVPQMLVDREVMGAGEQPKEAAVEYFRRALQAGLATSEATRHPLLQPLFLWSQDLKASLGWVRGMAAANLEEGKQQLRDAEDLITRGEYGRALKLLADVERWAPGVLGSRVAPLRARAQMSFASHLRRETRTAWSERRFADARSALEQLLNELPHLPDRSFVLALLVEELTHLIQELRALVPGTDRPRLQHLFAEIGYLVERYEQQHAATLEGEADRDPGGQRQTNLSSARDPEQLRKEAREACAHALRRELMLAAGGDDEGALGELLSLAGAGWLGAERLAALRREAYSQLAWRRLEAALAAGAGATHRELLVAAREAALAAGNDELAQQIRDQLVSSSAAPREVDPDVREAMDERKYLHVLELCAQPHRALTYDPERTLLREVAGQKVVEQVSAMLKDGDWEAAHSCAQQLVLFRPDDESVAELATAARRGLARRLVSLGNHAVNAGKWDAAQEQLARAQELDPDAESVAELAALLTERRTRAGGEPARERYDRINAAFTRAAAAGDVKNAVRHYRTLRRLDPAATRTARAAAWIYRALQHELENRGSTPEAARYIRSLLAGRPGEPATAAGTPQDPESSSEPFGELLTLDGERADVRALREALARADATVDRRVHKRADRRHQAVQARIDAADEAISCDEPDPLQALLKLARRRFPPNEHQQRRIDDIRGRAWTLLLQELAELERAPGSHPEKEQALAELADQLRTNEPELAGKLAGRVQAIRGAAAARIEHDDALQDVISLRDNLGDRPLKAYLRVRAEVEGRGLRGDPAAQRLVSTLYAELSPPARLWVRLRRAQPDGRHASSP